MSLGIIVALAVFVRAALALLPGRLLKYTYTLYTSCLVSAGSSTRLSSPQSPILPLYSRLQLNIVHAVIASSPYCAVLTINFFYIFTRHWEYFSLDVHFICTIRKYCSSCVYTNFLRCKVCTTVQVQQCLYGTVL